MYVSIDQCYSKWRLMMMYVTTTITCLICIIIVIITELLTDVMKEYLRLPLDALEKTGWSGAYFKAKYFNLMLTDVVGGWLMFLVPWRRSCHRIVWHWLLRERRSIETWWVFWGICLFFPLWHFSSYDLQGKSFTIPAYSLHTESLWADQADCHILTQSFCQLLK